MTTYGFIFARGGSKGLLRKNIKPLVGKPLIQYSIDTALKCTSIKKIFVSTDDDEIARLAREGGAEIINRPSELASDNASEWLAWQHAIKWVIDKYGAFTNFVSLPATSPLRSTQDIEGAVIKLNNTSADICISISPANRSPYFNMVKIKGDGFIELLMRNNESITRRQDSPIIYDVSTVVYAASPKYIINNTGIFSGSVTAIEVPKERAVDIDDIYDFMLAEVILNSKDKQNA